MRILVVVGTRPEAIKMAPVVQQLMGYPREAEVFLWATGQHREMLDQVLELFELTPDLNLDLMVADQTPGQMAGGVLTALDPLLAQLQPDWMLVQGDTTTVMAASIAAHYRGIRVGHVEAGLRSYDRGNPFPEEMNRVVTDHISDLHFTPTTGARSNLLKEGIPADGIFVTGNTVIDALLWAAEQPLPATARAKLQLHGLEHLVVNDEKRLILVTAHRRENHGRPLLRICRALRELAARYPDYHIIYPVHRNPNVWDPVHQSLSEVPGITLLPPVDYLTMVHLMRRSRLILTDSGGVQEEAPSLGIPVLVLREKTERPEAVDAGAVLVIGTDCERIVEETARLLDDADARAFIAQAINPYGDGHAAERIASALLHGRCSEFVY
jgi:UDP-N-acetylglucosamine 2-epimerase (non-hydrolysing)